MSLGWLRLGGAGGCAQFGCLGVAAVGSGCSGLGSRPGRVVLDGVPLCCWVGLGCVGLVGVYNWVVLG